MSNAEKSVQSVKLATSTKAVEEVELFELDGRSYTIPNKPRINLGLKVMRVVAKEGEAAGNAYMLEQLLGAENYDALLEFDDLTTEQFTQIVELASEIVFGGLEAAPKDS